MEKLTVKLLKKLLPEHCDWKTVLEWEENYKKRDLKVSSSYKTCLIATQKHGDDMVIRFGAVFPKKNYTEYDYKYYNVSARNGNPILIDKKDIIAVSFVPNFYIIF